LAELIDNFCSPAKDFASQFVLIRWAPGTTHRSLFRYAFCFDIHLPKSTESVCNLPRHHCATGEPPVNLGSFNELANGIGNP